MTWLPANEAPTIPARPRRHEDAALVRFTGNHATLVGIGVRYFDGSWIVYDVMGREWNLKDPDVLGWQALPAVPEGKGG